MYLSDKFCKGAKQKMNPSDFLFAKSTDKNLRVRIPVTFGGADKNWNVPYGLPLFNAVFTKAHAIYKQRYDKGKQRPQN